MKNKDNTKTEGYNLLILKALKFFIENPYKEIHLREFSRKLNISPNTAQRFLNLFLNEGLIKEERKANSRYLKANTDNILFKHIKITYSLRELNKKDLILSLKNNSSHVVLFGSVAKGLDEENSDIDLLIISDDKKKIKDILFNIQDKFDREINYHIFSWSEWKKQKTENKAFYQDIISTGINLIGEIPLVN